MTGKIGRIRYCFWALCLLLLSAVPASAVVMEGRIEGGPGLRFENLLYGWDTLSVEVVNMTDRNAYFGAAMLFLDRHGKVVARAELLPRKVVRNGFMHYTGRFTQGSGEAASRAAKVIWDFGVR